MIVEACPRCEGRKVNALGEPCVRCGGAGGFDYPDDYGSTAFLVPGRFGHGPAKQMCRECPLARRSIAGYLGGYTPEAYIDILRGDADIACHLSPGFPEQNYATMRSCTGVAHYRANTCKMPRGQSAVEAVEQAGKNIEEVFASPAEFLEHHKR